MFEKATVTELYEDCTYKFRSQPVPLTIMELQKRASKYFRMSPKRTMNIAEEL